jgi:hypothetical protein
MVSSDAAEVVIDSKVQVWTYIKQEKGWAQHVDLFFGSSAAEQNTARASLPGEGNSTRNLVFPGPFARIMQESKSEKMGERREGKGKEKEKKG